MNRILRIRLVVAGVFVLSIAFAHNIVLSAPPDTGVRSYIQGIESIAHGDYARAIPALSQAIDGDGDNESYRRARGVAFTLAENFPGAIADLERAERIDPNDTEARLWAAAAYRMSGDVAKGASLFTMRDLPHDYANLVYNVMAMQYWQSRYQGFYIDPATKKQVRVREPVRTHFDEAARMYAERNRATGAAAEVIAGQVKDAIRQSDWVTALSDLSELRANAPDDADLRGDMALALIGAGDAYQAREEFTRTLCVKPLWVEGYLGRAQAHFILGDEPRAQSDLEAAAALGAGGVDELRKRMSGFAAPPPAADAQGQFEAAALSDAPFGQLVDGALNVHRLMNAKRQRYDEAYQLRIRILSIAALQDSKNSDYPETLARFLFHNYEVPVIWDGPRSEDKQLRPQSTVERDNEIKRALELCDIALQLDDRNANAMATKGDILYAIKAVGAEDLADRSLQIDPENVRLLELKTRCLADRARDLEAQAAGLRAGHTDSHHEQRSDGDYIVTTHYAPTAEQLAQAAELEAQARQLREQIAALQAHSQQVRERVIPELLNRGRAALASGDFPEARRALTKAYTHDPDSQETLLQLAKLCKREGHAGQARIYTLLTKPLEETSAANDLKGTWNASVHTQWRVAEDLDAAAMSVDPVDARAAAYRSVIEAGRDNPDLAAARRWRVAALALEEARARLSGTTLLPGKPPQIELLELPQCGLAIALRLEAGNALLAANQPEAAIGEFAVNVAFERRMNSQALVQPVPTALLPDAAADANTIPDAPSFASLLGNSRFGIARADLALNRPEEAQKEYTAVRAYLANWPATAPGRETMNIVDSWARLGQAEAAYAAHDNQATINILESDGWPGGLPAELESRRKDLADKVHGEISGGAYQDVRRQMNQPPDQARRQGLEQEIAALQKQRDAIAAELADPNLSDRDRQVRLSSVSELDSVIAQQKAALDRLRGGGR